MTRTPFLALLGLVLALWAGPEAAGAQSRPRPAGPPRTASQTQSQVPEAAASGGEGTQAPEADEPAPGVTPAFPFSDAAAGNAPLEARLDSIRVEHADGRPSESLAVVREPDGPYLAVGDMGRIGDGFRWNPETWRGSLLVDSTEVGFALDSPVFWVRGTPVQVPVPVRYGAGTVLIPLAVLDAVLGPMLGPRCRWEPSTGRLVLAGPSPWINTLSLEGNDLVASLAVGPVAERDVRLRWDPQGILLVEVRGTGLPVDRRAVSGRVEGVDAAWVHGTGRGFEVALRLDPRWAAVRLRSDRGNIVHVEWTNRVREVQTAGYQPLGSYAVPARRGGSGPGRRVVLLEVGTPPAGAGSTGDCLSAFAERLAGILSSEFGHAVIRVADRGVPGAYRSPSGLPETPGVPPGDCWIGLRLDGTGAGATGEFTLVVPGLPARREPVRLGALATAAPRRDSPAPGLGDNPRLPGAILRMPPWGQVARVLAPSSTRLARTIADHLDYRWADRAVVISPRPARIFRGVGMPAVLVYPASIGDQGASGALCDETQATDLARNLAFAIDEYLITSTGDE